MNKYFLVSIFSLAVLSKQLPKPFLSTSFGMNNVTYTELQSSLQDSDGVTQAKTQLNGSASIMSLEVAYTHPIKTNQALFLRGITPLIGNENRMFSGGGGYQYFFGDALISDVEIESVDGSFVHFAPGFRYFASAHLDVSYLFYTGKSAKKTDLIFQIGPGAGVLYRWKERIDIKAQAEYAMGYGSVVTTTSIKILAGLTMQF